MSTSSDAGAAPPLPSPPTGPGREELRTGEWTRLGPATLLGDHVTEHALTAIADAARAAAQAQGYATGWMHGRRRGAEEARAAAEARAEAEQAVAAEQAREHAAAVAALLAAAARLHDAVAAAADRVEDQATELALALVEQLLGREAVTATGADVVRRVLQVLPVGPEAPVATVRVHPRHLADEATTELLAHGVRLVGDPGLGGTDAVVVVDDHALDLQVGPALARLREVLR